MTIRPRITKFSVTHHALVQLGRRCSAEVSRADVQAGLREATALFSTSNREVLGVPLRSHNKVVFLVAEGANIVTALTPSMAFADCPVAVFCFLVRSGHLRRAFALRSRYHNKELSPKGDVRHIYDQTATILWDAFVWKDR